MMKPKAESIICTLIDLPSREPDPDVLRTLSELISSQGQQGAILIDSSGTLINGFTFFKRNSNRV